MIQNSIDATLQDATMLRLVAFIQQMEGDLPFLISLTPEDRQALQSVADARLPYVLKCLAYCVEHRENIGMTIEDLAELQANARLFDQLTELVALVEDIYVGLRDTQMQAGAIFYRLTRGAHGQLKIAHKKGRPGMESILTELDKLFEGQGNTGNGGGDPLPGDQPLLPTDGQPGTTA